MESNRAMAERHLEANKYRWLPICIGTILVLAQPALAQERGCEVAEVAGEARLT